MISSNCFRHTDWFAQRNNFHLPAFLAVLIICLSLSGCVGGKVPVEKILRISPATVATSSTVKPGDALIVLRTLEAFPALERSAVMVAEGNVLSPSSRWFWEGTPATMITASLASGLQQLESMAVIWPERSRMRHTAILSGRVEAFEVQRAPHKQMVVRLRLSLWKDRGRELLATFGAGSRVPLTSLSERTIAAAAVTAMAEVNEQVALWLQTEARGLLGPL